MYGLAKETDIGFLTGLELEQVCFGAYQVILNFNQGVNISLECNYLINEKIGDKMGLTQLIGSRIILPLNEGDGEIALQFSNGSVLTIYDSNLEGESYQITAPGKLIIV